MSSAIHHTSLLSLAQAGALLQRHLPERDAVAWLETDRKYDPIIPFTETKGQFFYSESDLLTFLSRFSNSPAIRLIPDRRINASKRATSSERRNDKARRKQAVNIFRDHMDRRFKLRQERRSSINRRQLGNLDRRSLTERRGQAI